MKAPVKMMLRLVASLCLVQGAGAAQAQDWTFDSFDDGSFFRASVGSPDTPGLSLVCGERSPGGLSPETTGNMEPDITAPDSFRVYLGEAEIGAFGGNQTRKDVLLVAGSTGYRLPPVRWNDLFETWETDVWATDPVFAAIAGQVSFELRSALGARVYTSDGLGAALAQLTSHCQSMFSAIGKQWRTGASDPAPVAASPAAPSMRQAAEAAVQMGCGGPATAGPDAYLSGDIDGDGQPDAVVNWSEITCTSGYPRPFCGAAMCSANVFLSRVFPQRQSPVDLLSAGVRLIPLDNGNMGVAVGGSLSMCQPRGATSCDFIWYWNGADLVVID